MSSLSPTPVSPSSSALLGSTPDVKAETLAAAFAFFNETSTQLENSYRLLEDRVGQLTQELDQVSAEKKAEQSEKQQIASQMQVLLSVLPGGVIVLDARGHIVEANPAAQQLLASGLTGRLWRDVIGECFAPRNDDGLEVSTKLGRRLSVATSSLDEGKVADVTQGGQIILLTDLTETRQLQQHVSRSERLSAMGKMVSALAHQIRTPLSAAMLYADHLCHSTLSPEKRSDFSRKLFSRLQHMERQVRDMLLFVKSELPLNDDITLRDLEQGFKEAAEIPLQTAGAVCDWQNHLPQRRIKCHREALISALMNLINNGLQASASEPHLTVTFNEHADFPGFVAVSVNDKGTGMSAELLSTAREIFVTTKSQGTGLGLAVVQSVARAHGGGFELASPPNHGVTATLRIPLSH